jgi:hypothetical protein
MSLLLWSIPISVACAGVCASGVFRGVDWIAAAALCAVALVAELRVQSSARRRGFARARWPAAVIANVLLLALSGPLLLELGLRFQTLDALGPWIYAPLRLLGCDVVLVNGRIHSSANPILAYTLNWGKLGLLPALWIALGSVVLVGIYAKRQPLHALLRVVVVLCAYTVARFVILVALTLQSNGATFNVAGSGFVVGVFVHPWAQTLSFLPLALFLARWVPWDQDEATPRLGSPAPRARVAAAALAALTAAAAGVVGGGTDDSGPPKAGRVVIDELHSRDWSSSLAPLDEENFGRFTVYNYTLLVRFLSQYFDVSVNDEAAYSEATLADVDVLVLKTATSPFSAGEIDAIESFVRRGGGLFVVGDHTDLLGTSTNLNALTKRFEMSFQPDACNRLEDGQASDWSPLPWDTHPIASGLRRIEFMTSCTLAAPTDAQRLLVVRNAFSDALDYSSPSFFGDVAPDIDDPLGVHLVAAARRVGRGRVVLFGDSTVFSSFGLTIGGRSEFLLRTVDWLNREASSSSLVSRTAAAAAALALLGLLVLSRRLGVATWLRFVLPALFGGASLGTAVCASLNVSSGPPCARALPTIAIVEGDSDYLLPVPLLPNDLVDPRDAYDVFYTWTQRVGALPVVESLPQALERQAVVLIRPRAALFERFGAELHQYVRRGGALMVLSEPDEALRAFAAEQGVRVEMSPPGNALRVLSAGGAESPIFGALSSTVLVESDAGRLALVLVPEAFSRDGLGTQLEAVEPTDPRRELFGELFGAVRWVLGESNESERPARNEPRDGR